MHGFNVGPFSNHGPGLSGISADGGALLRTLLFVLISPDLDAKQQETPPCSTFR